MRTPNLYSVLYQPGQVPSDPAEYRRFMEDELNRIAAAIRQLAEGTLEITYKAPTKPRPGQIKYADGVQWNPGSGEGVYRRSLGGTWVFLG